MKKENCDCPYCEYCRSERAMGKINPPTHLKELDGFEWLIKWIDSQPKVRMSRDLIVAQILIAKEKHHVNKQPDTQLKDYEKEDELIEWVEEKHRIFAVPAFKEVLYKANEIKNR